MLRKLWKARLAEWLFGSGVAIACLVPVVARPSVAGGLGLCSGSFVELCTNTSTGEPCQTVPGDPTMTHACMWSPWYPGLSASGYPVRYGVQCPAGCTLANRGVGGEGCSISNSCYY